MTILLAGMATAYPQMKMQFVEVQLGQSNMLQGHGYSLFDKAVGDNVAFGESIHLGWGKDASRSLGAYLGSNIVSMPYYEEVTAAFSLGFEMRRYLEVNPSLRCYSGMTLGGICVANGYKLTGEKPAGEWLLSILQAQRCPSASICMLAQACISRPICCLVPLSNPLPQHPTRGATA